jgi:glycosyltransferase involved in cell wall biosynthesis
MATGLPVVGTEVEGIGQVILPGVNGVLVKPGDVAGLAAALELLGADPVLRHKRGAASSTLAVTKYSLKRCIDQTQRLFQSLARAELVSAPTDAARSELTRS